MVGQEEKARHEAEETAWREATPNITLTDRHLIPKQNQHFAGQEA